MPQLPGSQLYSVATHSVGMCEMLEEGKKGAKAGREGSSSIHALRGATLETASPKGSKGQGDASREPGGLMAPGTFSLAVWG